jgi:hypothetical protein
MFDGQLDYIALRVYRMGGNYDCEFIRETCFRLVSEK